MIILCLYGISSILVGVTLVGLILKDRMEELIFWLTENIYEWRNRRTIKKEEKEEKIPMKM